MEFCHPPSGNVYDDVNHQENNTRGKFLWFYKYIFIIVYLFCSSSSPTIEVQNWMKEFLSVIFHKLKFE